MPTLFPITDLLANQYVLLALGISISVSALAYMAGEFFSLPSFKGFAKVELSELGVTAAIIIIAIMLAAPDGVFNKVALGFALPDDPANPARACPEWKKTHADYNSATGAYDLNPSKSRPPGLVAFAQAHYFLGCRINFWDFLYALTPAAMLGWLPTLVNDDVIGYFNSASGSLGNWGEGVVMPRLLKGYSALMWAEVILSFLYTLDFGVSFPVGQLALWLNVGGVMPFTGLSLLSEANIFVVDALGAVWAAFAAQKMLLQFVETSALAAFLPLGIFMRAFPFARKTGSTIIALVFALYFVFPISILVNARIYDMIYNPQATPGCVQVGADCTLHSQCCSNRCRAGFCAEPLTDFSEFESIYMVCMRQGSDYVAEQWQGEAEKIKEHWAGVSGVAPAAGGSGPGMNEEAARNANDEMMRMQDAVNRPDLAVQLATAPANLLARGAFAGAETALAEAGRFLALAVLCIVVEIVMTMTLFKDFALLIGGEPRVFGLSKLV